MVNINYIVSCFFICLPSFLEFSSSSVLVTQAFLLYIFAAIQGAATRCMTAPTLLDEIGSRGSIVMCDGGKLIHMT